MLVATGFCSNNTIISYEKGGYEKRCTAPASRCTAPGPLPPWPTPQAAEENFEAGWISEDLVQADC